MEDTASTESPGEDLPHEIRRGPIAPQGSVARPDDEKAGAEGHTQHDGGKASSVTKADVDRSEIGIPKVLDTSSNEQLLQLFVEEYKPVGPTESTLVSMLARHAAGSDRWDTGGGAVGRETARHMPELMKGPGPAAEWTDDTVLAGTMATDAVDRCERRSMRRSREFLRTLEVLGAVQAARRVCESRGAAIPPLGFADEAACEQYLADRLRRGLVPCPNCSATDGCMLESRKCRECRGCKLQIGLRGNTIMARSPVPLRLWFDAVRVLHWRPTISAAELAEKIGLKRIATVRSMMAKIRTAMAAEDASERLGGLDRHFASNSST